MDIMHHSSKAPDRSMGDWFVYIEKGMVKLHRFQRMEAWATDGFFPVQLLQVA